MRLILSFRDLLSGVSTWIVQELDLLISRINTIWAVQHRGDGTHGTLTYQASVASGRQGGTLLTTDSGKVYQTIGATVAATWVLPPASAGLVFTFYCGSTQTLTVTASTVGEDTIRIASNVTAAAGSISSVVVGSSVTLVAMSGAGWVATAATGSWSF
jgi:hypothetical protein